MVFALAQAASATLGSPALQAAAAAGGSPPGAPAGSAPTRPDDIVVTARPGEHPARLGPVLPQTAEPLLPRARFDLGRGASLTGDVSTHPREGVAQLGITVTIPF